MKLFVDSANVGEIEAALSRDFASGFGHDDGLTIKVPVGWAELQVVNALAGTHIVTVPHQFFPKMCQHPKTDEAVDQFVTEFAE